MRERSGSGGDNAGEIVAVTRSDARASLDYRREAVVDDDADLLAAAVGEGGVDGDPAHEQLNDLLALGRPRGPPPGAHGSPPAHPRRRRRQGVVSRFQIGQPLIESLELLFHVGGDMASNSVVGELGAGVEVDGALAAMLAAERASSSEARSASATAHAPASLLSASNSSTSSEGLARKRETSDQTAASNLSPLIEAPMHLPWSGPRWAMEPLHL